MAESDKHAKRTRRAIAGAQGRHDRLVRVHRSTSLRGAEPVAGFVVSSGIRWVIVQRVGADLTLDGYSAVRWKHLDSVHALGPDDLIARAMGRGGIRPIEPTVLDPTTTGLLLRSIPDRPPLVTIWAERHARPTSWIGTIVGFEGKNLYLRPIDRDGRLAQGTFSIAFRDITRIDVRSRYASALATAAGLTPRRSARTAADDVGESRATGNPTVAAMSATVTPAEQTPPALALDAANRSLRSTANGATPKPDDAA